MQPFSKAHCPYFLVCALTFRERTDVLRRPSFRVHLPTQAATLSLQNLIPTQPFRQSVLHNMRLLLCSITGEFSLTKEFVGDDIVPPYAILSHTWSEGEEVTFEDLIEGTGQDKAGYNKIRFCGQQAERDGLQYFWVDTCC